MDLFIIHALPLCKACWETEVVIAPGPSTRAGHKGVRRGPLHMLGSVHRGWIVSQGLDLLRENK